MKPFLLDASVWVASLDTTDRNHDATAKLLNTVARGQRFAALDLTFYEVANVVAASWGSPADAHSLWTLMLRSCPEMIVRMDTRLFELMVSLADAHGLSAYDASYVAAAELTGWTLVSGDHADLVEPGHAITPAEALAAD
jgi:predicted nucleic acid-binding protein